MGQIGAYLRREGLYSSQIAQWRKQRESGKLASLEPQKRGPKADETAQRLAELERENEQLRSRAGAGGGDHRCAKKTSQDFRQHRPERWGEIVMPYAQEMAQQVPGSHRFVTCWRCRAAATIGISNSKPAPKQWRRSTRSQPANRIRGL